MRIPSSPPPRPRAAPAAPAAPPARPAAPATVARLLALVAQRPGVAVLLGAAQAGVGAPAIAANPLAAPSAGAPGDAAMHGPGSAAAIGSGAVADVPAPDARPVVRVVDAERVAPATDVAPDAGAASSFRVADAAARLDPAAWAPALHLPLVARLHARHPAHAVGLPHPARSATTSQLRALGRWLAERGEVATGDEELVRLARALRLDRRLVRVAAATLLLAALVFVLV